MKVTIASLFLTITSLAAAQWGGESCSEAGRVTCSPSNGQRYVPNHQPCVGMTDTY
ncbi:hypothetical protein N656DRAFT_774829 [Canariomyces notabilis]|uniref:Uncharacterized protein n=1 Tax=Canariomyces notabilis TaxID=2074819 RepID=A0AAN6TL77_9PEZI|nr:hypothetical protein N656DRAFT_774829 [Canariomyces arenarius]